MKMLLDVKTRLTLWYVLTTALILVVFSAATYFLLSESLYDIARTPSNLGVAPPRELADHSPASPARPIPLLSYTISEEWMEQLQQEQSNLLSVYTVEGLIKIDQKDYITPDMRGEQQVELFYQASPDDLGYPEIIAVIQPVSEVSNTLSVYKTILLYAIPIMAVLAALPGFFLIRRMLKPVNSIIETADEIGEKGLISRIEVTNPRDELGKLAATLNRTFDKLQNALKRERRFTADASHQLRTPLAIMRGETSLALSRERTAEDYRKSLIIIADELNHVMAMINRLLELTRAENGSEAMQMSLIDMASFLRDLAGDMEALCDQKGLIFKLTASGQIKVRGDRIKLRELFMNLLDNAVRYTQPGGEISLTLNRQGEQVCINVTDTGIGIASEHLPYIFERFYRVNQADGNTPGGSGLGLAICKSIADLHGGRIEVKSAAGKGSTFTVILPSADS